MERIALKRLNEWKNKQNRKPLIVQGARQVGKTWLMQEFGRLQFSKAATKPIADFMANEGRFQQVKKADPERYDRLVQYAQEQVDERRKLYEHLAAEK